jgi:hypothetical protein
MMNDKLREQYNELGNILNDIGERIEGNLICDIQSDNDISDIHSAKIHNIQTLCRDKRRICEIGINAGHSLLLMLDQNPNAEYFLFDLNNHTYTIPALDYIKTQYPNTTIHTHFGDTKLVLTNLLIQDVSLLCSFDFIHVDGGHDTETVVSDFTNTIKMINDDGIVVFDDYNYGNIKSLLDYFLRHNFIKEIKKGIIETELHLVYQR